MQNNDLTKESTPEVLRQCRHCGSRQVFLRENWASVDGKKTLLTVEISHTCLGPVENEAKRHITIFGKDRAKVVSAWNYGD